VIVRSIITLLPEARFLIKIGDHRLRNPVVLAPMAGITDLPFRRLVWRLGAGYVVSEMLASKPELWNTRKSRLRRRNEGGIRPHGVQIAGGDAEIVAYAAAVHVDKGADVIDINMGCPAKKVCRKAAGSALMRDEGLVARILRATVDAVAVPVTLKIRTGWAPDERNAVRIAQIAEDAGIAMISVHGRTRACRFEGNAEYKTVARVKRAVSVPVIANGDITSINKASEVVSVTGADGVMIGRGALGRPWLPGHVARGLAGHETATPAIHERAAIMLEHVSSIHDFYGEQIGVRFARKHVKWYLQAIAVDCGLELPCSKFNSIGSSREQLDFLEVFAASRKLAA
jgi:tRNA-dihydrouridine synthase B